MQQTSCTDGRSSVRKRTCRGAVLETDRVSYSQNCFVRRIHLAPCGLHFGSSKAKSGWPLHFGYPPYCVGFGLSPLERAPATAAIAGVPTFTFDLLRFRFCALRKAERQHAVLIIGFDSIRFHGVGQRKAPENSRAATGQHGRNRK
jgi:hypothetical protein